MKPRYPTLMVELRPSSFLQGEVGLFAVRRIASGAIIVPGSVFDESTFLSWAKWRRLDKLTRDKLYAFCPGSIKGIHVPPDMNAIPIPWYINHSCSPNAGFSASGDLVALKRIPRDTEITWDYSDLESNPKYELRCCCGSKTCRGIIRAVPRRNTSRVG